MIVLPSFYYEIRPTREASVFELDQSLSSFFSCRPPNICAVFVQEFQIAYLMATVFPSSKGARGYFPSFRSTHIYGICLKPSGLQFSNLLSKKKRAIFFILTTYCTVAKDICKKCAMWIKVCKCVHSQFSYFVNFLSHRCIFTEKYSCKYVYATSI